MDGPSQKSLTVFALEDLGITFDPPVNFFWLCQELKVLGLSQVTLNSLPVYFGALNTPSCFRRLPLLTDYLSIILFFVELIHNLMEPK